MRCHGYGTQILITLRGGGITEWVLFQLLLLLLLLLSVRSGGHAIDRWMGLPPSLLPLSSLSSTLCPCLMDDADKFGFAPHFLSRYVSSFVAVDKKEGKKEERPKYKCFHAKIEMKNALVRSVSRHRQSH